MMALDKPPVKWQHDNILSIMSGRIRVWEYQSVISTQSTGEVAMMALDKSPVKWLHDNTLSIMSTNQGVGIPIRDIYTIHRWSSHDGIGQIACKVTAWQHPVYNVRSNQGVGIPIRDIYTIHWWSSHDGIGQIACKVTAWQHPVYNVNESGCGNTNPWYLHNPLVM